MSGVKSTSFFDLLAKVEAFALDSALVAGVRSSVKSFFDFILSSSLLGVKKFASKLGSKLSPIAFSGDSNFTAPFLN